MPVSSIKIDPEVIHSIAGAVNKKSNKNFHFYSDNLPSLAKAKTSSSLGASELIKKRRTSLGIDQKSLSEIAGVAIHTLSNLEAGTGNPTVETLDRVLDVLGMEIRIGIKK